MAGKCTVTPVRPGLACVLALLASACHSSEARERAPDPPDAARGMSATATATATASALAPAPCAAPPPPLTLPPDAPLRGLDPPLVDISDDRGALDRVFDRTARLLRGRAPEPVRIAVYGDSNGTMDYMTGEMRRVLQASYGDAGHGFVALARPWPWYRHQYVVADYDPKAWSAYTVTTHPTPSLDPWYGHGLIAAQSRQTGARTWVQTAADGSPIGTRATAFEVYYLAWPSGGAFDVVVDGEVRGGADTRASAEQEPTFGFVRVEVPDGPHKMTVVTRDARQTRLLGAVVERGTTGFQVDGLGVGSLNCLCVMRESEALDRAIFEHRPYDLVIWHIGSNTFNAAVMDPVACMNEAVARLRRAMPGVSVMIMTPPDWGEKGATYTPGWMKKAEAQLRQAAGDSGTAFYDFRAAMGGEGSMAKFLDLGLTQGDGIHFNDKGGAFVADRLVAALSRAYAAWAEKHPTAGCE
jgi:hypothetical protein